MQVPKVSEPRGADCSKVKGKRIMRVQDSSNLESVGSDPGDIGSLFQSLSWVEGADLAGVQCSGELLGIRF